MPIKKIAQDPRTLTKEVSVGYGYKLVGLMVPGDSGIYISVDSLYDLLQAEDEDDLLKYGSGVIFGQDYGMQVIGIDQLNRVLCDFADQGNNVAKLLIHASLSYFGAKLKQVDKSTEIG